MKNNVLILSPNDVRSQYILTSKNREFSFYPKFGFKAYNCLITVSRKGKIYLCNIQYSEGFEFNPEKIEISGTNISDVMDLVVKYWKKEIEKNENFLLAGKDNIEEDFEDELLLDFNEENKVTFVMNILDSINEKKREINSETDEKKKAKLYTELVMLLEREKIYTGGNGSEEDYYKIGEFLLNDLYYQDKSINWMSSSELYLSNIGLKNAQKEGKPHEVNGMLEMREVLLDKLLSKTKETVERKEILIEAIGMLDEQNNSDGGGFDMDFEKFERYTEELEKIELKIVEENEKLYRGEKAIDSEFNKRRREQGLIDNLSKPSERYGEPYGKDEQEEIIEFLSNCYDGKSDYMKIKDDSQKEEFLYLCEKWGRTPGALRFIGKILFTKKPFKGDYMNYDEYTLGMIKTRDRLGFGDLGLKLNEFIEHLEKRLDDNVDSEKVQNSIQNSINSLKEIERIGE